MMEGVPGVGGSVRYVARWREAWMNWMDRYQIFSFKVKREAIREAL